MEKGKAEVEVSRKNAQAVMVVLERQDRIIEAQDKKINELHAGLSALGERLQALEQAFNLQRARAIGSGPTVR